MLKIDMAFDKKIIEFAKGLYLQVNENKKKVYSLRDISNILLKKFGRKISYGSISYWAKTGNWDNEVEIIKSDPSKETVTIKEQTQNLENQFVDDLLKDYKNAKMLANVGYDAIFKFYRGEKTLLKVHEALQAVKIGTDIKNTIRGLPELTEKGEKEQKRTVWKFGENYIEF